MTEEGYPGIDGNGRCVMSFAGCNPVGVGKMRSLEGLKRVMFDANIRWLDEGGWADDVRFLVECSDEFAGI